MTIQQNSWQPALHAAFGQIAQDLKAIENLDPDLKIQVIFFKTEFRVRARLAGYYKFIDLFEVTERGGEFINLNSKYDLKSTLNRFTKSNNLMPLKAWSSRMKLEFWFSTLNNSYLRHGHY